jgi:hypothetical protein
MPGLSMLLLIILGMDAGAASFGLGLRMGAVVEKQKEVEEGDLYGFYMDCIMNYSVLHAFERMTGLDALGFSGGSHHAR